MEREDILIISQHSDLSEKVADKALKENVYNDKRAWQKFLRLLFISLGVGFTLSGIVFFFAYNWADLHKFAKIGLTEGLLISTIIVLLFIKTKSSLSNIILTGASVLVGVLFAVFGQIYQTGANAYDFFLAWTVFISLWALVANFPPLWLLYLILLNTTLILFSQQVAKDWSSVFIYTLLFSINLSILICAILLGKQKIPNWFLNTVTLLSTSYATIGIIIGIFSGQEPSFPFLILLTAIAFTIGIRYGLKTKNSFYLAVIPFSIIIMLSALLLNISNDESMFLAVCLFIIGAVTLTIKNILNLQKQWTNEK